VKKKEAEERSYRIVIKGRKVMSRNPINKNQKRENKRDNTKDNEDESLYFLFDTDC
jgi:hypothetical protein